MALGFPYQEYQKAAAEQAARILAAVGEAAKGSGLDCATYMSRIDIPPKESSIAPMRRDAI
ncbi:MAG: hypothetical protein WAN86_25730 [Hyphomicrobiaceae bacterium]